jgi:hypothetical protein
MFRYDNSIMNRDISFQNFCILSVFLALTVFSKKKEKIQWIFKKKEWVIAFNSDHFFYD